MNHLLLGSAAAISALTISASQAAQAPARAGFGGAGSYSPYAEGPTAQDFLRYYPERARHLGIEGRASINCLVVAGGAVTGCMVASEAPAGMEFGDAAMRLATLFKMKTVTADGKPVVGMRITIPVRFQLAQPSPGDDASLTTPAYWLKQPTFEDLESYRPPGLSTGGASLQCHVLQGFKVSPDNLGRLTDCKAVQTSGSNVSAAALKLASKFQLNASLARVATSETLIQFNLVWPPKK